MNINWKLNRLSRSNFDPRTEEACLTITGTEISLPARSSLEIVRETSALNATSATFNGSTT